MSINVSGAYIYFIIPIFGGIPITQTTVSGLIVTLLLCTCFVLLGKGLTKRPGKKQVLVEKGVMMLHDMVVETMGAHNAHWTPFIGTIFLCSLCGSFIGLTGFFAAATIYAILDGNAFVAELFLIFAVFMAILLGITLLCRRAFLKKHPNFKWKLTPRTKASTDSK